MLTIPKTVSVSLRDIVLTLVSLGSVFGSLAWGYGVQHEKMEVLAANHTDEKAAILRLTEKVETLQESVAALNATIRLQIAETQRR